jgi:hypothetical protein
METVSDPWNGKSSCKPVTYRQKKMLAVTVATKTHLRGSRSEAVSRRGDEL